MKPISRTFRSLGLDDRLLPGLERMGLTAPTPIQQQAIPPILEKADVLGIAKTGSGKTAAYLLPLLHRWLKERWENENRHVPMLILIPTRELAVQILEVFQDLTAELTDRPRVMSVFGGVSINPQMKGLSGVQWLIATPGRLLDLIDSKAVHLDQVRILVMDEADKLLNMGFKEEIGRLTDMLPKARQNLLFSATLSKEVENVVGLSLKDPRTIRIEEAKLDVDLIQQRAFRVAPERKGPFLRFLIKSKELHQVLIFTSSVLAADKLVEKLTKNGIDARASHSKKSNKARLDALSDFKSGALRVLVATDLLSRGIDIDFLPYVINYELPRSPKDYIHRIGRTGRAENPGEAFTLVTPEEQHHFKVIQKKMGKWLTLEGTEQVELHGF